MTTQPPATTLSVHAADWQRELISQAWLYSTSMTRAVDELEQVVIAIFMERLVQGSLNKGKTLDGREETKLGEAIYKLKHTTADFVLNLYPATAARAQEIARTLPHANGPTVSIEDFTDDAKFKKIMREIYKEAGISEDFGG